MIDKLVFRTFVTLVNQKSPNVAQSLTFSNSHVVVVNIRLIVDYILNLYTKHMINNTDKCTSIIWFHKPFQRVKMFNYNIEPLTSQFLHIYMYICIVNFT